MTTDAPNPQAARRRTLKAVVAALCAEAGFVSADEGALETLTEMLQGCLSELGRTTQGFAELAGRIQPMLADVVMATVDLGLDLQSIQAYARRTNRMSVLPPQIAPPNIPARTLQAGQKKPHPAHIPDTLPIFPDPHTYIRTPTHKEPVTEYQIIREQASSQKRDVERALTRFIAKTGDTESLFSDDPYAFPLIANKPKPQSYMEALGIKEEDMESPDDATKQQAPDQNPSEEPQQKPAPAEETTPDTPGGQMENPASSKSQDGTSVPGANPAAATVEIEGQIDNPYLRAIKMPKLKGVGKKFR